MSKVAPELVLNADQLPDTTDIPKIEPTPSKPLPKPLADFKQYVESKFCYHAKPVENAELISVEPKMAFQCHMKILIEARKLRTEVTPYRWQTETVLGSRTLGRFFEETELRGEAIGHIWNDYQVDLPSTEKSKQTLALVESISYLRCSRCRGKCIVSCTHCSSGLVASGTKLCSYCKGAGKVTCSRCKGLGGFRHTPTLTVKWHTQYSTWFYQNSFLHVKRIRKGQRTQVWSVKHEPWSKQSSIENVVQSIQEETPDIPLKENIIKDYYEKQLNPVKTKNNAMRRLECSIERMNFEEVRYKMGENYQNKKDPTLESTFRFCQYPGPEGKTVIYENDYPLNCCGCFGEKAACYSSCCTIL
ncbi:unnamed protein product [Rotaria socialis]|uniref:Protein SSUH2 homolog n=1 Tax=Rotaria socialis TaxID=392032 RepID=A0A821HWQ3_9BILA|nr:unnamed protein product [Rotaria socialis]CAF4695115.1 unnamed protein product [Rotaria socialis]